MMQPNPGISSQKETNDSRRYIYKIPFRYIPSGLVFFFRFSISILEAKFTITIKILVLKEKILIVLKEKKN